MSDRESRVLTPGCRPQVGGVAVLGGRAESVGRGTLDSTRIEKAQSRPAEYHFGVSGWVLVDAVSALVLSLIACWASPRYGSGHAISSDPAFSAPLFASAYAILLPLFAHVFGLHSPLLRRLRMQLLLKCAAASALALMALIMALLVLSYSRVGRYILLDTFLLSTLAMTVLRLFFWRMSEESRRKLVVLGSGPLRERMAGLIFEAGLPYEIVALEDVKCPRVSGKKNGGHPLACLNDPRGYCRQCGLDEIVTCYPEQAPRQERLGLSHSLLAGLQVSDYSTFIERTFFKVPVEQIDPDWFFQIDMSGDYAIYRGAKRIADIFLSAAGLALSAPILLLATVLIRLESRGPAFYSQVRLGQFGRVFRIWKLRSMREHAESDGAQWARQGDPRVTRIGRILRLTRLDEVPQFWNVLRGEMSFVGPRPERPEFVEDLAEVIPFYQQRHLLKPGITGWAQIHYPYGATTQDALNKLKYDLYYVKHASALLDIQIVLRTIGAVMKGAR